MPIYVDNAKIKWRGREWCHLVADTVDELHDFAMSLGLKRSWYQQTASYPHYDITSATRIKALQLGAQVASRKKIIECAKSLKIQQGLIEAQTSAQTPQLSLF
ncbi:DUF4031 domain-containing protein [Pseudomonas sp. DP-17]|uniref:DUF4031 domain-containing protein n=1 Tax=Pseudomonas sp. DP-17 TaxID=1580486 RepID=UPI001EFB022A|nr:DUF4031 domain-containing protein [Pseudomonas sp. DP-17]MCG8911432.1 DUF4031 domain-containing protein [Pseudomonas sp. DP-17]